MIRKVLFEIKSNDLVALSTYRLELQALCGDWSFSGEFVDIALEGFYLRRPLSVCDSEGTRITLIYKVVGEGTRALSQMLPGRTLEVLTGRGRVFDASACAQSALLVGGGLGAAPLHHLAKELKALGRSVHAVLGFNGADDIVLEEEFRSLCDSVTIATMDGSAGVRGLVTDAMKALQPQYDFYYTCGPVVMMKAVCEMLQGPGEASLEERMGCGAGFCYGCSCRTLVGTKRICKDGPVFRTEEIIW